MNETLLPPSDLGLLYVFESFHIIKNGEVVIYKIKRATEYGMSNLDVPNTFVSGIFLLSLVM
jgi:hypothetical protein